MQAYGNNFSVRNPFSPENGSQIQSCFLVIHYAKARTLADFFHKNQSHLLSVDGDVEYDERTNALYLRDYPENIAEIKKIVNFLDIPQQEILIKARLVNVDEDFSKSLGILFGTKQGSALPSLTPGNFDIPLLKLKDSEVLEMELSALEQNGHAHTLSKPELVTLSRQPAVIESGEEIPYQELTPVGGTSVTFKKATLSLRVVPTLLPKDQILLELTINQDKVGSLSINGTPTITTQELQTRVIVKNAQTVVLGGIFEQVGSKQDEDVPGLKNIPLAGVLFHHTQISKARKQLLIIITPEVIKNI